ncbi:MAG: peptidoglycan DD-metalloendopeptidase family protein [Leptospira sp.]|nr:peptidoglycan DD-metalloendopeptidase family protein [Leptospira sp.]
MIYKLKKKFIANNPYLKNKIDSVKEKGHQRLTVFVIPHGHDSSFNFQISMFAIFFIISLLFSLIGLSIYGITKSANTKIQLDALSQVYGKFFDEYVSLTEDLGKLQEDNTVLSEDLSELFTLVDGNDEELLKLHSESDVNEKVYSELRSEELADKELVTGKSYLSEIYEFRQLKVTMEKNQALLDANLDFLGTRASIIQSMPLTQPLDTYNVTSTFGYRRSPTMGYWENHDGIDLANAPGTPIFATAPGRVSRVIYSTIGYGHHIIISHDYGYYTLYGHCSKIYVSVGQTINRGAVIGLVGSTGNTTGPHLHYEVWSGDSVRMNPEEFLHGGLL